MRLGATACIALFVLYGVFAGQASVGEAAAGLAVAALSAAYAVALHRSARRKLPLAWPPLRRALKWLAAVPQDALLVGVALLRSLRHPGAGTTATQPFDPGGEDEAGRRAIVTLGLSLAPNGIVVSVPPGPGGLRVHRILPAPADADRRWPA